MARCYIILIIGVSVFVPFLGAENYSSGTKVINADDYSPDGEVPSQQKVEMKLFYESLCPDCIEFDPEFANVVIKLLPNVDALTYPYGNAYMNKNADGSVTVTCQHGEAECYGNKLHACAIDILGDLATYLQYNACLMGHKSNDSAANKCGRQLNISARKVRAIKDCAKGSRGQELLVQYGQESELVNFNYVPYVLLNGKVWSGEQEDLMKDVCALFTNPPEPCMKTYE